MGGLHFDPIVLCECGDDDGPACGGGCQATLVIVGVVAIGCLTAGVGGGVAAGVLGGGVLLN